MIASAVVLGLVVLLGCVALWLFTWPFRMAAVAAGIKTSRRSASRKGLIAVAFESTLALLLSAFGLARQGRRIGPSWHPCENCGAPIEKPSRAAYCSQACRRDANIRARAQLEGVARYE